MLDYSDFILLYLLIFGTYQGTDDFCNLDFTFETGVPLES